MARQTRLFLVFGTLLFIVLEVMLALAILWWPAFEENIGALKKLASPLPMLGQQIDIIGMMKVPGYVVGQHYFKGCNVMGAAAAVLFAMGAIAGEAQRGTMEIWLARPVSRLRLYAERWIGGQAAIFLSVLLSSLTVPLLLKYVDESMRYDHLVLCSIHQSLFLGALFSTSFMLSAFSSQPLKIAFVMLFLSIFQFAIYMVKTITHYSAFRLSDIEAYAWILKHDTLDWRVCVPLVAVNVVTFVVGYRKFRTRTP